MSPHCAVQERHKSDADDTTHICNRRFILSTYPIVRLEIEIVTGVNKRKVNHHVEKPENSDKDCERQHTADHRRKTRDFHLSTRSKAFIDAVG